MAGPCTTAPAGTSKRLPWRGQSMVPAGAMRMGRDPRGPGSRARTGRRARAQPVVTGERFRAPRVLWQGERSGTPESPPSDWRFGRAEAAALKGRRGKSLVTV